MDSFVQAFKTSVESRDCLVSESSCVVSHLLKNELGGGGGGGEEQAEQMSQMTTLIS